ncbi:hypothetical protein [Aggregatibacter actinomycetemcomitans]|uniref:hypothetical protein n=1 Tax=Aggregatibacter actinomycetemcomitans TaxID=714 RepID=UPI0002400403|nr:hypothetical protein [Aggregatibacter actinomycetemcomitans]EHK90253.1 hypothetical protein RHAA1_05738 [Aggregatibacter actinomycetemcomitans RhAA1]KNE77321.1 hypothetical protein RHAA2_05850 [Aggregatibacter actinomycetemcomitans RhAA1]
MNENKTTGHVKSKLKSAVAFILKIVLALALVIGIAAIGMQFFPQLTGMQDVIRHNWFNLLLWRLMLYAALAGLLFNLQKRFSKPLFLKLVRLFIMLAIVVEFANIVQLLRG